MNKAYLIILCCIFLIMCSCRSFVAKTLFGVTDPKLLSNKQILNAALKYKLDTSRLLYFKDPFDWVYIQNNSMKRIIPDIIILDEKKQHLLYKADSIQCNGNAYKVVDSLIAGSQLNFPVQPNDSTWFHFKSIQYFDTTKVFEFDKTKQYHIFLMWAKHAGITNKSFIRDLQNKMKKNEKNYAFYLVNMDINSSWGNITITN